MAEVKAYSQAAHTGKYDKATGLLGKYDNVRRFWEDQVTGIFLRPALNDLVDRKKKHLERLRILDLGCGSGDGYDLLMGVASKTRGLCDHFTAAISPDILKEYVGLDINEDLLRQAQELYGHLPKLSFIQGDLSDGLPDNVMKDEPFDVYFTSFGTYSHFTEDQNVELFADILRHAPDKALVMGDWLGRFSVEWQDLWHYPLDEESFMEYRISYIYPEEERDTADVASFPLRLMNRDEVNRILDRATEKAGVKINPLVFFDRSLLVGRHTDTGDYNKNCPRLRSAINSLFEGYLRTDLERLLVDYVPREGFDHINDFFESFFNSTNALVTYTMELLEDYDQESQTIKSAPEILPYYPEPLKEAMKTMKRVVDGVGWVKWGDVRANVIEPHLGYSLRKLEMDLQPGNGFGHGLIVIFEVQK